MPDPPPAGPIYDPIGSSLDPTSVQAGGSTSFGVSLSPAAVGTVTVNLSYSAVDGSNNAVNVANVLDSPPSTLSITNGNTSGSVTINTKSNAPACTVTVTAAHTGVNSGNTSSEDLTVTT
jgi:hypothetical protein